MSQREPKDLLQELRNSELKFRSVMESTPDAIVIADEQGRIIYWNRGATELFGYRSEEILGQSLPLLMPEKYREAHRQGFRRFIETRKSRIIGRTLDLWGRKKDGTEFPLELSLSSWEAGNHLFFSGILRDVSARRQSEEKLKSQTEIIERAHDAVVISNLKDQITYWNQGAQDEYGWSREEVMEKDIHALLKTVFPKSLEEIRSELLQTGYWEGLLSHVRKDGSLIDVNSRWTLKRDFAGSPAEILQINRDITEQKRAEKAQRVYTERLRTLSHRLLEVQESERRRIARELHDEVGQSLTALKINLEGMSVSPAESGEGRLSESLHIADQLIREIRDLSLDLRPLLLDELGLIPALRWYLKKQSERTGLSIQLKSDSITVRPVPEVETACYRVVQEAVTNVVKHAQARRVLVDLVQEGTRLVVLIADDGIGFNWKGAQEGALRGESSGLLNMRERVNLVGGEMEVQSTAREGTAIRLFFPYAWSRKEGSQE